MWLGEFQLGQIQLGGGYSYVLPDAQAVSTSYAGGTLHAWIHAAGLSVSTPSAVGTAKIYPFETARNVQKLAAPQRTVTVSDPGRTVKPGTEARTINVLSDGNIQVAA